MALKDEFQNIRSQIASLRRYAWSRFGEEAEKGADETRWRALVAEFTKVFNQMDQVEKDFPDLE